MNKKILAILLVAAMAASSTAVLADEPAVVDDNAVLISDTIDASNEGIMLISEDAAEVVAENEEFVLEPTFVSFNTLKVVSVEDNRIETVDENDEIIFLNTSKAVFYNNDGTETSLAELEAGDELDVFVRADEPAPAIVPAEYTPAVIVNVDTNVSEKVTVDTFIPNPDGGYINTSGDLVIHLPEGFTENKRLDNDFIVFYSITTMSIPPQAPADKVVLLTEPANEFETTEDMDVTGNVDLFTDVYTSDEFAADIYEVVQRGLFKGVSDTEFMPDGNMTRAMFVTVLGRLEGFSIKDATATGFSDTPGDEYYSSYVVWANENNIVNGYDDGTFRPNNQVTREEAMQIIWNYCTYKGIAPQDDNAWALRMTYTDLEDMSEYAMTAGMWNKLNGYFTEDENENIRPKDSATRAEVAHAMSVLASEIDG